MCVFVGMCACVFVCKMECLSHKGGEVAYVNIHVSRQLKEELGWAIDERLQLIINKMLFNSYTIINVAH